MWSAFRVLFRWQIFKPIIQPILRPLFRILMGLIAIPIFRFLLRKVFRVQDLDDELEKDLEQWFKATLVLLAATKNMEMAIFGSLLGPLFGLEVGADDFQNPLVTGLRIMMAIGVIEMMPDQELFAIIHPGPPRLKYDRDKGLWKCTREQCYPFLKRIVCQHLNRASPVFAILCAIFDGTTGWVCFGLAITQYLIIGLVTSRDRALDALSEFDRQVAIRREELKHEFGLEGGDEVPETSQSPAPDSNDNQAAEEKTQTPIPDGKPSELAKEMP